LDMLGHFGFGVAAGNELGVVMVKRGRNEEVRN
jgi:hypothetical protein